MSIRPKRKKYVVILGHRKGLEMKQVRDGLDYSMIDSINESAIIRELQHDYEEKKQAEYKQDMNQAKVFSICLLLAIVLVGLVEAL